METGSTTRVRTAAPTLVAALIVAILFGTAGPSAPAQASASTTVMPYLSSGSAEAGPCDQLTARTATESAVECVGGAYRRTRGKILGACITNPKALVQGASYKPSECVASGGIQAEAVAHARAIANLNHSGAYGAATNGVTPRIQWETTIGPESPSGGPRPDLLFDHGPDASVGVVEVKVERLAGNYPQSLAVATDAAAADLAGYLSLARSDPSGRSFAPEVLPGYVDRFFVETGTCKNGNKRGYDYVVQQPLPGTLVGAAAARLCSRSEDQDEKGDSATDDSKTVSDQTPLPEAGGFKGRLGDLLETYSRRGVEIAALIKAHESMRTANRVWLELSSRQVQVMETHLRTITVASVRKNGGLSEAAIREASERGIVAIENFLAAQVYQEKRVLAHVGAAATDPAAYAAKYGTTREVAEKIGSKAFREAAEHVDSVGAQWARSEVGMAAERRISARVAGLMDRQVGKMLIRIAGRSVVFIPVIGQAIFAIWTAYDLITIVWDLMKLAGWGDPHLITLDGSTYDLQALGEFTLLKAAGQDIEVQGRFSKTAENATSTAGLAIRAGNSTIDVIRGQGAATVDGLAVEFRDGGMSVLEDGSLLVRVGDRYLFTSADGKVVVGYEPGADQFRVSIDPAVKTQGLLGDNDGDPRNDFATASGEDLSEKLTPALLHGRFADSWRVTDETSAFFYDDDESSADFTDRTFPANIVSIGDFPPEDIEVAGGTCRANNVSDGPAFEDCVFDVLVSGNDRYAAHAAAVSDDVIDPLLKGFGAGDSLNEDFSSPVPTNFAAARYMSDPETGRVAGPYFEGAPYSFYVLEVPRHDTARISMDVVAYGDVSGDARTQEAELVIDGASVGKVLLQGDPPAHPASTQSPSASLVKTGETANGRPISIYRVQAPVPHFGKALKVNLQPIGFKAVHETSLGIARVELALDVTSAQTFDVNLPLVASPNSPVPGAGSLESGGAEDIYRFNIPLDSEAEEGLQIVRSCQDDVKIALRRVGSADRLPEENSSCSATRFVTKPGDYELSVTSTRGAGTYSLQAFAVPKPQRFALGVSTSPLKVSEGVPGAGAGKIETIASRDRYDFSVPAGGRKMQLDNQSCPSDYWSGLGWQVIDRGSGQVVESGNCRSDVLIDLPAGDYLLEFTSNGGYVGAYVFELYFQPAPNEFDLTLSTTATLVSDGVPASGAGKIETIASVDRYRFSIGGSGANLVLDNSACPSDYWDGLQWQVRGSNGTVVGSGKCTTDATIPDLSAGEYVLEYKSSSGHTGAYSFGIFVQQT